MTSGARAVRLGGLRPRSRSRLKAMGRYPMTNSRLKSATSAVSMARIVSIACVRLLPRCLIAARIFSTSCPAASTLSQAIGRHKKSRRRRDAPLDKKCNVDRRIVVVCCPELERVRRVIVGGSTARPAQVHQ
jgi:hypothetical protein